ncbi:MAG: hypothetical protein QM727_12530 [Niabella sp.]
MKLILIALLLSLTSIGQDNLLEKGTGNKIHTENSFKRNQPIKNKKTTGKNRSASSQKLLRIPRASDVIGTKKPKNPNILVVPLPKGMKSVYETSSGKDATPFNSRYWSYTPRAGELLEYDPDANYLPGTSISKERIQQAKNEYYYNKSVQIFIPIFLILIIGVIVVWVYQNNKPNLKSNRNLIIKYDELLSKFQSPEHPYKVYTSNDNVLVFGWPAPNSDQRYTFQEVLDDLYVKWDFKANILGKPLLLAKEWRLKNGFDPDVEALRILKEAKETFDSHS